MTTEKQDLLDLSFDEMETFVLSLGWKKYRAKQIIAWIYQHKVDTINAMSTLSKQQRTQLSEAAQFSHLKVDKHQCSTDGTQKFLFELRDGKKIETVLIPEDHRQTLCISSQAGCTLDCTFCLTAKEGLKRNLRASEIVAQIISVQARLPKTQIISNIVLMGMGEPLANLKAVTEACCRMISPFGLALAPRRITVSTAGLVPQMKAMLLGPAPVNLSISLNATTDAIRNRLMPKVNKLYNIETLITACKYLPLARRRSVTFEYVMLDKINDSLEDAARLLKLTRGLRCKINLIPFNTFADSGHQSSPMTQILKFQDVLIQGKLRTTIRKSKGQDILAACGQLSSSLTC